MDPGSLVSQYAGLAGMAAAVAVIINILKHFGLVRDGTGQTWSAGLNIVGMDILFVLQAFVSDVEEGVRVGVLGLYLWGALSPSLVLPRHRGRIQFRKDTRRH